MIWPAILCQHHILPAKPADQAKLNHYKLQNWLRIQVEGTVGIKRQAIVILLFL